MAIAQPTERLAFVLSVRKPWWRTIIRRRHAGTPVKNGILYGPGELGREVYLDTKGGIYYLRSQDPT